MVSDGDYFPLTALSLLVEVMVSYEAQVGEERKSRRVDWGSGEWQELVERLSLYADPRLSGRVVGEAGMRKGASGRDETDAGEGAGADVDAERADVSHAGAAKAGGDVLVARLMTGGHIQMH